MKCESLLHLLFYQSIVPVRPSKIEIDFMKHCSFRYTYKGLKKYRNTDEIKNM